MAELQMVVSQGPCGLQSALDVEASRFFLNDDVLVVRKFFHEPFSFLGVAGRQSLVQLQEGNVIGRISGDGNGFRIPAVGHKDLLIVDDNREGTGPHTLDPLIVGGQKSLEHILIEIPIQFLVDRDKGITDEPVDIVDVPFLPAMDEQEIIDKVYNVFGAIIRELITPMAVKDADNFGLERFEGRNNKSIFDAVICLILDRIDLVLDILPFVLDLRDPLAIQYVALVQLGQPQERGFLDGLGEVLDALDALQSMVVQVELLVGVSLEKGAQYPIVLPLLLQHEAAVAGKCPQHRGVHALKYIIQYICAYSKQISIHHTFLPLFF